MHQKESSPGALSVMFVFSVNGEEGTRYGVFQTVALERAAKDLALVIENEVHVGKGVIAFII